MATAAADPKESVPGGFRLTESVAQAEAPDGPAHLEPQARPVGALPERPEPADALEPPVSPGWPVSPGLPKSRARRELPLPQESPQPRVLPRVRGRA